MKRANFVEMLVLVAQSCEFELTEPLIGIYDQALQKYGYDRLCYALKTIIVSRRTRDPFPSIREIYEILNPQLEAKDMAVDAAARIISSVSRFGRSNPKDAEAFMGSIGWEAVRLWGGWSRLCDQLTVYNTPTMTAQFRDLCQTVVKKSQLGVLHQAPMLPEANPRLKALTDKVKSI